VFNGAFPYTLTVNRWAVDWDMVQAEYIEGITLDLSTCAPNMTVADVVSGLINIGKIAVNTDDLSHVVTFAFLDDYLLDTPKGIDWRERIDHMTPPVKVQPEVPSVFEFRFKDDKKDELLIDFRDRNDRGFGDADHVAAW
jgi:hypothetical protein